MHKTHNKVAHPQASAAQPLPPPKGAGHPSVSRQPPAFVSQMEPPEAQPPDAPPSHPRPPRSPHGTPSRAPAPLRHMARPATPGHRPMPAPCHAPALRRTAPCQRLRTGRRTSYGRGHAWPLRSSQSSAPLSPRPAPHMMCTRTGPSSTPPPSPQPRIPTHAFFPPSVLGGGGGGGRGEGKGIHSLTFKPPATPLPSAQ